MSSNIKVQRICNHCNKLFEAKTTVTKFCSNVCSKRAYKAKKRNEKIDQSNNETKTVIEKTLVELKTKEYLTVAEVGLLLNCSKRTIYRLIENGRIHAVNLSERKTTVRRADIEKIFDMPEQTTTTLVESDFSDDEFVESECFNLSQIQQYYSISETALQKLIQRLEIPKYRKGIFAYVPQKYIIEILGEPNIQNSI